MSTGGVLQTPRQLSRANVLRILGYLYAYPSKVDPQERFSNEPCLLTIMENTKSEDSNY